MEENMETTEGLHNFFKVDIDRHQKSFHSQMPRDLPSIKPEWGLYTTNPGQELLGPQP